MSPILTVIDLQVSYYTDAGRATALAGASFASNPCEKLGLVWESGSGKSTMALAMMRMIKPPGRIEGGQVIVDGADLRALTEDEMPQARLSKIAAQQDRLYPTRRDEFAEPGDAHRRADGRRH